MINCFLFYSSLHDFYEGLVRVPRLHGPGHLTYLPLADIQANHLYLTILHNYFLHMFRQFSYSTPLFARFSAYVVFGSLCCSHEFRQISTLSFHGESLRRFQTCRLCILSSRHFVTHKRLGNDVCVATNTR